VRDAPATRDDRALLLKVAVPVGPVPVAVNVTPVTALIELADGTSAVGVTVSDETPMATASIRGRTKQPSMARDEAQAATSLRAASPLHRPVVW